MVTSTGRWAVARIRVTTLAGALVLATGAVSIAASPGPALPTVPPSEFEFVRTGNLAHARIHHTATLLDDGRVLVIGGYEAATAEIWNPTTGEWSPAGTMAGPREGAVATLLPDGRVLVEGGHGDTEDADPSEVWDPVTRTFGRADDLTILDRPQGSSDLAGGMGSGSQGASHTLLIDGRLLVAGGRGPSPDQSGFGRRSGPILRSAEMRDPATGQSTPTASMVIPRTEHTATLLPDGRVLLVGSHSHGWEDETAELFRPNP